MLLYTRPHHTPAIGDQPIEKLQVSAQCPYLGEDGCGGIRGYDYMNRKARRGTVSRRRAARVARRWEREGSGTQLLCTRDSQTQPAILEAARGVLPLVFDPDPAGPHAGRQAGRVEKRRPPLAQADLESPVSNGEHVLIAPQIGPAPSEVGGLEPGPDRVEVVAREVWPPGGRQAVQGFALDGLAGVRALEVAGPPEGLGRRWHQRKVTRG